MEYEYSGLKRKSKQIATYEIGSALKADFQKTYMQFQQLTIDSQDGYWFVTNLTAKKTLLAFNEKTVEEINKAISQMKWVISHFESNPEIFIRRKEIKI